MKDEMNYEQLRALQVLAGIFPKEIAELELQRKMVIAALGSVDNDKNHDLRLRLDEIDSRLAKLNYDYAMGEYGEETTRHYFNGRKEILNRRVC